MSCTGEVWLEIEAGERLAHRVVLEAQLTLPMTLWNHFEDIDLIQGLREVRSIPQSLENSLEYLLPYMEQLRLTSSRAGQLNLSFYIDNLWQLNQQLLLDGLDLLHLIQPRAGMVELRLAFGLSEYQRIQELLPGLPDRPNSNSAAERARYITAVAALFGSTNAERRALEQELAAARLQVAIRVPRSFCGITLQLAGREQLFHLGEEISFQLPVIDFLTGEAELILRWQEHCY